MNDIIEGEFTEVKSLSMVQQLVKAEIDIQVATAHQYPRSMTKANKNITSLATMSHAAAEECNYALPRGGKAITGPSIRLAEIVSSQWGNCRVGARVVHVDLKEKYVEAEGIFHDLETNAATTMRVRRRISGKNGKLFNDDMIIMTGNAACSIAKRNAILAGVPKAVWNEAYEAALRTIKGDQKTLVERRDGLTKAMAAFGLTPDDIFALLGVDGIDDITLEHMPVAMGMHNSLKSGEVTVEELFQTISSDKPQRKAGDITGGTNKVVPKPKPNPAADKAIEEEAKRVAAARAKAIRDAESYKEDDQKREDMQKERDEAESLTESDDSATEDEDHDKEAGEIKGPDMVQEPNAPDLEQFKTLYDTIVNDLIDASSVADVADMYGEQITQMLKVAPELHTQLMEEFEATK